MTRRGDTILAAALKRYGKKIQKYIQKCLAKNLTVKILVEDARDSSQKTSGAVDVEIEIEKSEGWGKDNFIQIHGSIGVEKSGKRGKKEDEAYLDGVTVGDWEEGSKAIGLNGCSVGEFLTHIFTLFAIKAGNESVLLDNAAGPRGKYIYKQVGFIKSKGDRAQYGEDNEMIFSLTGKKKNKDAGQLWRERYNKFRKKLATKIKTKENCKDFWKCVPPVLEAPGPVHTIARGSKKKTRKKRGGVKWKVGDIIWKTVLVNDPNRPNIPIERGYYKIIDRNGFPVGREGEQRDYILLRRVTKNSKPWLTPDQRSQGKKELGSTGVTGDYLDQFWEVEEVAKRRYKLFNIPGTGATHSGGNKKKTRKKRGGEGWTRVIINGIRYAVKYPLEIDQQGYRDLYDYRRRTPRGRYIKIGRYKPYKGHKNPQEGSGKRTRKKRGGDHERFIT